MKRLLLAFSMLLITGFSAFAQNQFPPSIKWKQINTKHFSLIFPPEIEPKAQKIANFLENIYPYDIATLHTYPKKTFLVLDNTTVISNGYSRLAPKMMFWYLCPYPNTSLGITQWYQMLAIHEFRHITQFKALDKGTTKIAHFLFGQAGQAGFMFFSTPTWFFEGDAVFNETALSLSGRGRVGYFFMPVKTIFFSYPKKKLNYYKFYLQSYKTFYPNQYYLGYYMVSYVNRHFSPEIWAKITKLTSLLSFLPNSMNIALQKYTKLSYRKLFDSTIAEVKKLTNQTFDTSQISPIFVVKIPKKRTWTNYIYPFPVNKHSILALKYGFDNSSTLVLINSQGKELIIRKIQNGAKPSYSNFTVAWNFSSSKARWGLRDYSDIATLNIKKGLLKYITSHQKLLSPTFSPNGKKIAAVQFTDSTTAFLTIIDANNGKILMRKNFPNINYIRQPAWLDSNNIVFIASNEFKGSALMLFNIKSNTCSTLIPFSWNQNIQNPVAWKNYVIFSSDLKGTPNLFAVNIKSKKIFQITNTKFGANYPAIDTFNNRILFSFYTPNGYSLAYTPLNPKNWKPSSLKPLKLNYFYNQKTKKYIYNTTAKPILPENHFHVRNYNHLLHWPNFHSWLILPDINQKNYGLNLNLFANDYLNETQTLITAGYFQNHTFFYGLSFSLMRYFPILSVNFKQYYNLYAHNSQTLLGLGIKVPLDFSHDIWTQKLDFSSSAFISKNFNENNPSQLFHFSVSALNSEQKSYRDLESRFAQYIKLYLAIAPKKTTYLTSAYSYFNFPGFLKHDIFQFIVNWQDKIGNYFIPTSATLPRGYKNIEFTSLRKISINYLTPLLYPDCGIYRLLYVKRISTNMFYDFALVNGLKKYSSTGLQILFDFDLFGLKFDFNTGIQIAYLIEKNKFVFSPVVFKIPL